MKLLFSALFGLSALACHAQKATYQWLINGAPVNGATSVSFISTFLNPHPDSVVILDDSITYKQIAYAGKLLHRYRGYHVAGNVLQLMGVTAVTLNLIEMNRTGNPVSGYIPVYVTGGALFAAGYILNDWVAPGLISKAGISLQGNVMSMNLEKRKRWWHREEDAPEVSNSGDSTVHQ